MWPTRVSCREIGDAMKVQARPTGTGMLNPVNPRARTYATTSGIRRGSGRPLRASSTRWPSGVSHSPSAWAGVSPDDRKCCTCPPPSSRVITPTLAPVRERAESKTPWSTAGKSRLWLMRRLAWERADSRSRSAWFSRLSSSSCIPLLPLARGKCLGLPRSRGPGYSSPLERTVSQELMGNWALSHPCLMAFLVSCCMVTFIEVA